MICGFLIYPFALGVPTFEKKLPVKPVKTKETIRESDIPAGEEETEAASPPA